MCRWLLWGVLLFLQGQHFACGVIRCLFGLGFHHETHCFLFVLVFDYQTLLEFGYQVQQPSLLLAIAWIP